MLTKISTCCWLQQQQLLSLPPILSLAPLLSLLPLLSVLILLPFLHVSSAVEVVTFQPDGVATLDTIGIYKGTLDRSFKMDSVTLCGRFKIFFLHGRDTFFQLRDNSGSQPWMMKIEVWPEKLRPALAARWNFMMLKEMLQTFRWYHVCFTYSHELTMYNTWVDGVLIAELEYNIGRPIYGDYAYIGQGVEISESYSGDLTQVNVWDKVLSPEEIVSLAACESDMQGNYISWDMGFALQNVESYDSKLEELCKLSKGAVYFWFDQVPPPVSYYICEALGSRLPLPLTSEEALNYLKIAKSALGTSTRCHVELVVGTNDIESEGKWIKYYDNSVYSSEAWTDGEPNGLIYENCAQIETGGMADIDCVTRVQCAVCEFHGTVVFSLLGTCELEMRNTNFLVYQESPGNLVFGGYGEYNIKKIGKSWVWMNIVKNNTIATMAAFNPDYPMGRRMWKLHTTVCEQNEGERMLLLTHCNDQQYSCDDATCISLENRCDLKYDCLDHSDEVNCETVVIPADYKSDLPPRHRNLDGETTTLPVALNVIIESMAVETSNMVMQISHIFTQTWFDNRLTFLNLKSNVSLNTLYYRTVQELWSPTLSFVNTDGNQVTSVSREASMQVERLYPAKKRDGSAPAEIELYSAAQNPISLIRKYSTAFICDFDLVLYPFDDQFCDMHIRMLSASTDYLQFDVEGSTSAYAGSQFLIEYEIGSPFILNVTGTEFSEMRIRFPLTRRYGYAMLNIYTPSLILIIISYATLFFRVHIFEVRVMTALTALLVEATLFTQVSSSLPKTSYFKMVDVWLLFCIVIIFLTIIFHAIIDYYLEYDPVFSKKHDNGQTKVRPLNGIPSLRSPEPPEPSSTSHMLVLISRIGIFALFVLFNLLYWGIILG